MRQILLAFALLATGFCAAQAPELLSQERWPDGTLRATRYQEADRVHFITYHENGRVKEIGCFRSGRRDGVWKQFSDTGALMAQAGFRNGQRQGVWMIHSADDRSFGRLTFSEGDLARAEQFDGAGALVAHRNY